MRLGHRIDAGAQHFGEVSAAEKGHGDDRGSETRDFDPQRRQGEVDEEQLNQQRRVACQLHIQAHQSLQVRRAEHQNRRVEQRHQQRGANGDKTDLQRHTHGFEKRRQGAEDECVIESHEAS
ncbi:hypothetical protein D3C72_641680 [compost metagenome]